ncbi:hypothetical protein M422DRAFT_782995 [Sphaerobolus stellatus SS14]|uniref:Uncharacterized protein n=1 Tax=Sphaerobolus stellatus (strain SS14) TaxID=990650 RepID=A0A0C9V9B3_SPHS4|nr:hypothetical protein M422DRAFT_782995 [Sphaerobolus stellatus SS14]
MRGGCDARHQIGRNVWCRVTLASWFESFQLDLHHRRRRRLRPRYRHTARKIGRMEDIPQRENLGAMLRIDIQKLCKDNNIKANMRTDEMINALFDLVNGKDVPRPHRAVSERGTSQPPISHVPSTAQPPPPSKQLVESAAKKCASGDGELKKVQAMQMRLGKGKPIAAGANGARKVTSKGGARSARASRMLQEETIAEEDEEATVAQVEEQHPQEHEYEHEHEQVLTLSANRPSSTKPFSPTAGPSHLSTPAPSQLSFMFPNAQLTSLEARLAHLESQPPPPPPTVDLTPLLSRLRALEDAVILAPKMEDVMKLQGELADFGYLKEEVSTPPTGRRGTPENSPQFWIQKLEDHGKGRTLDTTAVSISGIIVQLMPPVCCTHAITGLLYVCLLIIGILEMLYGRTFLTLQLLVNSKIPAFSGILRISTKYLFEDIRETCIDLLHSPLPDNLQIWQATADTSYAAEFLQIIQQHNIIYHLPQALYSFCSYPASEVLAKLKGRRNLLAKFLEGKNKLSVAFPDFMKNTLEGFGTRICCTNV